MAIYAPLPGEKLIYSCGILWKKNKFQAFPGDVYITDQRVIIEKHATPGSGGLAQMMIKSYRPQVLHAIPYAAITRVKYSHKKALIAGENYRLVIEFGGQSINIAPHKLEEVLPLLPNVEEVPWE